MTSPPPVPKCGASDQRNIEYEKNYSPKRFFDFLVAEINPIIFDIGAHQGESIEFFKAIYPSSVIYSFEPNPDNYTILAHRAKTEPNVFPCNIAIGSDNTTATFYKQDVSHLGGLLPINSESKDSLGYASKAQNAPIDVRMQRLDSFCNENDIPRIDILKIDTQGFECEVIKGAKGILSNVKCVTVEISLYDFYQAKSSSPLLNIEQLMSESGFALWDISKISKNPKNLRTDWIECVYKNTRLAP